VTTDRAWRKANAGHVSLGPIEVMVGDRSTAQRPSAGMSARCEDCAHEVTEVPGRGRRRAMAGPARGELLPTLILTMLVFTLPAAIATSPFQNKAVIYDLLFKASARRMITIAADPKTSWAHGSVCVRACTHGVGAHPPSPCPYGSFRGGIPWTSELGSLSAGFSCRCDVLSRLFRRLFLEKLCRRPCRRAPAILLARRRPNSPDRAAFAQYLAPSRKVSNGWFIANDPSAVPRPWLAYLSRYTHRVAISNSACLLARRRRRIPNTKDYRIEGRARQKIMRLTTDEFIRRFPHSVSCQPAFTAFAITACSQAASAPK